MTADEIKAELTVEEQRCIAKIRHLLPYDETYDATAEVDLIEQSLAAARKREREMREGIREIMANISFVPERSDVYEVRMSKEFFDILKALLDGDKATL